MPQDFFGTFFLRGDTTMPKFSIPGWGDFEINNLVLDFNGTIATDGKLIEGVAPLLGQLHEQGMNLYVITADTNGTVKRECASLPVQVMVYDSATVADNKMELVIKLGAQQTASIGNGRNDRKMFAASALSIAVIGEEGTCVQAALQADVLVSNILQALQLLTCPHRLKATLRG